MIKLGDLKLGEEQPDSFDTYFNKLMKWMSVEKICVERRAPLGDPIAISVSGYLLSVREEEANSILVNTKEL